MPLEKVRVKLPKSNEPPPPKVKKFREKTSKIVKDFFGNWFKTRPVTKLLLGLPAFLVLTMTVAYGVYERLADRHRYQARYQADAQLAMEDGRYEEAQLLIKKLIAYDPKDPEHRLRAALCYDHLGDTSRAFRLMTAIAPSDDEGYPMAHYWLAEKVGLPQGPVSDREFAYLAHHYRAATRNNKLHNEAHGRLVQLYSQTQDYRKAIEHCRAIRKRTPQYWLTLLELYELAGSESGARRSAREAISTLEPLLKTHPEELELYRMYSTASTYLKQFEQAIETCKQGLQHTNEKDKLVLLDGIASIYCQWYDNTPDEENYRKLELIDLAMKYGPNVPDVLIHLAEIVAESGDDISRFDALREAVIEGRAPAAAHFVIGAAALERKEYDKAEVHLNMVLEHQPFSAPTLNNLAWIYLTREPPAISRALKLAEQAIRIAPNDVNMLDTHARIVAASGDFRAAIKDYEKITKLDPTYRKAYEQLAKLYERVGLPDLARVCREKLKLLMDE